MLICLHELGIWWYIWFLEIFTLINFNILSDEEFSIHIIEYTNKLTSIATFSEHAPENCIRQMLEQQ